MAKKHLVLMLLCCLIPIGVALGLLAFGVALNTTLLVAVMLLCPLLHMLMMSSMHGAAEHNVDSGRAASDHADFHIASQHHPGEDAGN
jgi:hypothetical protein